MKTIILISCLFLAGCQLPQWRVFQTKVPEPIVKGPRAVEVERQAADLLAKRIEKPVELIPVAQQLSASLGRPEHPLEGTTAELAPETVKALEKELLHTQGQLDKLNKLLTKNEGKKVEGTGINVFGVSFGLGAVGLVVLCFMFPPIGLVLWSIFKRLSGALTSTAKGISNYISENPEAGEKLKGYLAKTQDAAHKAIISNIKAKL